MSLRLLCLFVGAAFAAVEQPWNYNRCDRTNGPANWNGGVCKTGSAQTPIDLCGATNFPNSGPPSISVSGYDTPRTLSLFNNGHTIQVPAGSNPPTLNMGNIANIVWGTNVTDAGPAWTLSQVHLHWGRSKMTNEGSEHYMQGVAYPAEAHLVHYNPSRGKDLNEALATGASDAVLVVGVFLTLGESESTFITVASRLTLYATQTPKTLPLQLQFSDLFNGLDSYYSYRGSLTTPPCSEAVTWVVAQAPKTITLGSLSMLKMASACPALTAASKFQAMEVVAGSCNGQTQGTYGNFRPLQSLNGRPIYSSSGPTAGCTTNITAPNYYCNAQPNLVVLRNAAPAVHASLSLLLAALALLVAQAH